MSWSAPNSENRQLSKIKIAYDRPARHLHLGFLRQKYIYKEKKRGKPKFIQTEKPIKLKP
jgi:hypothetical protein